MIMSTTIFNIGKVNTINHNDITINTPSANVSEIIRSCTQDTTTNKPEPEDVVQVDTSFFGVDKFPEDVCEKNLREAITGASSKADACRRIMLADTCGYIHIKQYTDEYKAKLINPYAAPLYTFTDDDFKKARNRKNKG